MVLPSVVEDLLNPALLALLLRQTASGYAQDRGGDPAMVWPLAFVAAPMILHGPTRQALPRRPTSHLTNWAQANELLVAGLAPRARSLSEPVRAGLRLGLRLSLLEVTDSGGIAAGPAAPRGKPEGSLLQLHRSARLVGRWFARTAEPSTVFAVLRARP